MTDEYSAEELWEMMLRITILFGFIFIVLSIIGGVHSQKLNAETCLPICEANNMELISSKDGANCLCLNENNEEVKFSYQWGNNQ